MLYETAAIMFKIM